MKKIMASKNQPVMIDTCILMVGVERENSDPNYGFDVMRTCYLEPLFNYFTDIKIHEMVWGELDDKRHEMIKPRIGVNVEIVSEGDLYGKDPIYTTVYNKIADHEFFNYRRGQSKNRGDVYSLAYAAHFGIPFFSTRDGIIIKIVKEILELKDIELLGFEYILVVGYLYNNSEELNKRFRSLYKLYCEPAIKQNLISQTFNQFLQTL